MALVEVDVDLSDFEDHEIFDEASDRIKRYKKRHSKLDKDDLITLKSDLEELNQIIGVSIEGFEIKTLDDKLKMELLVDAFKKYSLSELQSLIRL